VTLQQVWIWTGVALSIGAFIGLWLLYRFYKRVGRRCDCGEITKVHSVSKIIFSPGDDFSPYIISDTLKQLWQARGLAERLVVLRKFRWWFRNVETVTFRICPPCEGKPSWRKVVTISSRPISLWHLYWVWFTDRNQLLDDPQLLNYVLASYLKDRWSKGLTPVKDTPENPTFKVTLSI